jgi:hypothetical protein
VAFSYASALRSELRHRNIAFAKKHDLAHVESYGQDGVVVYVPNEDAAQHGNFVPESYRAILADANWRRRLAKYHSQHKALPRSDRGYWCELDSSCSSDALLMNVFCHPGTLRSSQLWTMLGVEATRPEFGVRARVPLIGERQDRTELDMRLGPLLVEAKLTEGGFQTKEKETMEQYRDFAAVFVRRELPQTRTDYLSYQLLRNVLAAYATDSSFCVLADARRPDLLESWHAVMRCVRPVDMRLRCKMLTWQELATVLPRSLQNFLGEKYGIGSGKSFATSASETD